MNRSQATTTHWGLDRTVGVLCGARFFVEGQNLVVPPTTRRCRRECKPPEGAG
jgi:hypothetical protein